MGYLYYNSMLYCNYCLYTTVIAFEFIPSLLAAIGFLLLTIITLAYILKHPSGQILIIANTIIIMYITMSTDVVIWLDSGCSCSYSTNEGAVPQVEVCAVIQFINGSQSTTQSDYSVVISPDTSSASAQRMYWYCMHRHYIK